MMARVTIHIYSTYFYLHCKIKFKILPFLTSSPRVNFRTGIILFLLSIFYAAIHSLFMVIACLREFEDVLVFSQNGTYDNLCTDRRMLSTVILQYIIV